MSVRSGQQAAATAPEGASAGGSETPQPGLRHPAAFLRAHDPGLFTLKRAVSAAVVVPCCPDPNGMVAVFPAAGATGTAGGDPGGLGMP